MSKRLLYYGYSGQSFINYLNKYSNVVGFFSFLRGAAAYTGRTQRARQSTTEQDIFLNGNFQDNSQLLALAGSSNAFTPIWENQANTANPATQTVAGNQPQVVSNGNLITSNGLAAMQFNGSSNRLNVDGLVSSLGGNNQPQTWHIVAELGALANNTQRYIFSLGRTGTNQLFGVTIRRNDVAGGYFVDFNKVRIGGGIFNTFLLGALPTSPILITCDQSNGNNGRLWVNGIQAQTNFGVSFAGNYTAALNYGRIGNRFQTTGSTEIEFFNGKILQFTPHNASQFSANEITNQINDIKSQYGIL
jgi:hypothetical protein